MQDPALKVWCPAVQEAVLQSAGLGPSHAVQLLSSTKASLVKLLHAVQTKKSGHMVVIGVRPSTHKDEKESK